MGKLKNYALLAAVGIILCLAVYAGFTAREMARYRAEAGRLADNQETLLKELDVERNKAGNLQASVDVLTLRKDELEELIPSLEKRLKDMGVKLRKAEHVAQVALSTTATVEAVRDTVYIVTEEPFTGSARYTFVDEWLTADIVVENEEVASLSIVARDSLTLVAHKQRRKCIFKKPKVSYTVESASPYTTITGMNYIEITN